MAYVIGIDTGGTYTDAVLLDMGRRGAESILRKSKALTTHSRLEEGIEGSLKGLGLRRDDIASIDKVVLSTTLATNAIVEGKLHRTGLIIVGDMPRGDIAADYVEQVPGKMNIKGRVLVNVDRAAVRKALDNMLPYIEAVAVSGASSVRNPSQEREVKELVREMCSLPVMCGHELASQLGYLERTNTAAINAGLLPIIDRFIRSVKSVLADMDIKAPVFVVKGDGSIATEKSIKEKPIDTALSGPAASMIGTINLTGIENAVVTDMGGTTTDTGIVKDKRVELSEKGADIGGWRIKIKSAKLHTIGLGGDSAVRNGGESVNIGPERVLPACRGGAGNITPTDLLHYTGEFIRWERKLSAAAIEKAAAKNGKTPMEYAKELEDAIVEKIYRENIEIYKGTSLPICAIGAPAGTWYGRVREKYCFDLIIPENYEVANAVGAATAGIHETSEAVIRAGEEGHGYLIHTEAGRFTAETAEEAVKKAVSVAGEHAAELITKQNLELDKTEISCREMRMKDGHPVYREFDAGDCSASESMDGEFVEIRIKARASGKSFI